MGRAVWGIPFAREGTLLLWLSLVIVNGYVVREQSDYPLGKEKTTHLHFFFHDTAAGKNQTAFVIAKPSAVLPFSFGNFIAIDDVLTAAVSRSSKVVGSAQGFYALTGLSNLSLVMAVDFGFTAGKFRGSSFSVLSRNVVTETTREMAVVGGRGKFRLARGFAILTTRSLSGLNAIVEYNVTLLHY